VIDDLMTALCYNNRAVERHRQTETERGEGERAVTVIPDVG